MRLKHLHIYLAALLLSVFAIAGCSHIDDVNNITDQDAVAENDGNILRLRISMAAPEGHTRATANPTGGETGDGWRLGLNHENDIHEIYLYKYSSSAGINAPDNTPVTLLASKANMNFSPESSEADVNGNIVQDFDFNVGPYRYTINDHFIAAINTGNLGANTTLGNLRNEIIALSCKRESGSQTRDYNHFTMSNANDSHFAGGEGTEDNPYLVNIDVERTAARIDFAYSSASRLSGAFRIEDGKYIYKVLGETNDEVHLTHVRATNVMQTASYLIKRLATTSAETPIFLADETAPATKYVVEPTTWSKTIDAANNSLLNFNRMFNDSWYITATQNYDSNWFREEDRVHCGGRDSETHNAFTDGTTLDEKGHDWQYYVVSYANENTMLASQTLQHYTTGLILKATYKPEVVYGGFEDDGITLKASSSYAAGTAGSYVSGNTFWRWHDVATNKDLFFSNEAAALSYQSQHPYSVVYPYENAQCYYNVWLRHENITGDPSTTMMEFGIVRNNIYRVCVEFTGIGMPEVPIEMTTPETIRMYIHVRKWNLIEHPTIEI